MSLVRRTCGAGSSASRPRIAPRRAGCSRRWRRPGCGRHQSRPAGDFAYVEPDELAAHGWMVAVRADGPGSATRVRRPAVGSARSVPRAAAVFVGREV